MGGAKKCLLFLGITFAWSWAFWALPLLHHNGLSMPALLLPFANGTINPAAWGPLIGAIITAFAIGGLKGAGRLLRRGVQFKFAAKWYLAIFAIFPLMLGFAWAVSVWYGGETIHLPAFDEPFIIPVAFLFILFLGGPLQEEFGWRGTLLDPLQNRFGALVASLIVGAVWAIWHLPLFYIPGDTPYYDRPIWGLLATTMLISVLFTWVYNNTGKSIAAMLLFHTMFNFSHFLFPTLGSNIGAGVQLGLQIGAAILVVGLFGARYLRKNATL